MHRPLVKFLCPGILVEQHGSDVVQVSGIGKCQQRTGTRHHAMALILAVGSVADFFRKRIIGVLQGLHHGGVYPDIQRFEAIQVACRIEQPIDGLGVRTSRFRQSDNSPIGFSNHAWGVWRIIDQTGSLPE